MKSYKEFLSESVNISGNASVGTISDTLTLAVAVLDAGVTNAVAYGAMT